MVFESILSYFISFFCYLMLSYDILWPIAGGWGVFDLVGEIIPGVFHLYLWGRIIS